MKVKKLLLIIVCGALALNLTGCSFTYKETVSDGNSSSSEATSSKTQSTADDSSSQSDTSSAPDGEIDNTSTVTQGSHKVDTGTGNNSSNTQSQTPVAEFVPVKNDETNYNAYFVDSVGGNDDNDGKTPSTAWQSINKVNGTQFDPGTKVLFKSGSIWNEPLIIKSSGTAEKTVVFDKYGSGNRPVINGDGEIAAVQLSDVAYVEVRNLELTNISEYSSRRFGVFVSSGGKLSSTEYREGGIKNHIYLINLNVHDIDGITDSRWNAGIMFDSYVSKTPAAFNDILVEGCTIKNVEGNGFTFCSEYNSRTGLTWGEGPYFPSTNMAFRNNYVGSCSGDGVFVNCAENALLEYNTVTDTSYAQGAFAGMWPHNSTRTTMQYNELFANRKVGGDGQGLDVDINSEQTVVQYNYSHDNEGGFILLCTDGINNAYNRDITVRYNISQNDKDALFTLSGPISDVKIYNNTFYVKEGLSTRVVGSYNWGDFGASPKDALFTNNIFYMDCTGQDYFVDKSIVLFDTNLFFGKYNFASLPQVNTITADPKFTDPGTAGLGISTTSGYKLSSTSPCIDAGKTLTGTGGRDYFGVSVPQNGKTDIGACEYK